MNSRKRAEKETIRRLHERCSSATIDLPIADFAVAMSRGQIKSEAPCPRGRLAKYNGLLAIEREPCDRSAFLNPVARS